MNEKYRRKSQAIYETTAGETTFKWLAGVLAKRHMWPLGALSKRGRYEAWVVFLFDGLQDPKFLEEYERTSDPWHRSKLVGTKISQLAEEFSKLTKVEKDELAKRAEVELKAGIEMLIKDKKKIMELLQMAVEPLDC